MTDHAAAVDPTMLLVYEQVVGRVIPPKLADNPALKAQVMAMFRKGKTPSQIKSELRRELKQARVMTNAIALVDECWQLHLKRLMAAQSPLSNTLG
jgi:hypothetical protein